MQRLKSETQAQFEARRAAILESPAGKKVVKAVEELKKVIEETGEDAKKIVIDSVPEVKPPVEVEPAKKVTPKAPKVKDEGKV